MDFADEVKQRLERGQTAATYIELIDIDEVEGLSDAYLTLQDGKHLPAQQPPPLTSDEFKRYVRLVYDAIKSVDMAADAFKAHKDGSVRKTTAMEYIDSVTMFEIQLVAGRLVKAVYRAQSGIITMPPSTPLTGMRFHKYSGFPERMDKVIAALQTWKSFGKALFTDQVTMEKRLAMQPEQEKGKKGENNRSNTKQHEGLQFAKAHMPKTEKPAAVANNDEGVDENKNADDTPAPANKKRRLANPDTVPINRGGSRGSNRGAKRQPAAPSASPSASANARPSVQSASSAAFSSDGAGDSIQPAAFATPIANNTAGSAQPDTATGPAFTPISRPRSRQPADASLSTPNTGITSGRGPFDRDSPVAYAFEYLQGKGQGYDVKPKFPGPQDTPLPQYGDQSHRLGGLGTNQRPLSQMPQLPQTPQPAHLPSQHPHQQHQPPPDYLASQRAAYYGYQQSGPQRNNPFSQASQQSRVNGAQGSPAQNPRHQQAAQHGDMMGSDSPLVPDTTFSNDINAVRTSGNTGNGGTVVYTSGGVVHNYFQPRTPSPPQAFASPRGADNQSPGNFFGRGNTQNDHYNQGELEPDNSLPPRARGNSPPQAPTADAKVGDQDQEDDGGLPGLHPSNYSLPPF